MHRHSGSNCSARPPTLALDALPLLGHRGGLVVAGQRNRAPLAAQDLNQGSQSDRQG